MLMGPRRDIEVGQIIKMIVLDKRETRYMFDLKVIDPRKAHGHDHHMHCLLYTSPRPRDGLLSRMQSSA